MARKMTPLQKKYKQAFKTVERRITKLESQGYIFDKSKLPTYRKSITTAALKHVQKFTEKYLKNMPSTKFRVSPTKTTTGARGAEIQASASARKAARKRRFNKRNLTHAEHNQIERDLQRSLLNTKYKDDERFAVEYDDISDSARDRQTYIEPDGTVIDAETGEIIYEPDRQQAISPWIEDADGSYVNTETGEIIDNPYLASMIDDATYGEALVDGLDGLISDYEQSDNRWVREKAEELRDILERSDRETLADNLGHMSSDFITYVQQVLEESGGNQGDVNDNYAKLVEIEALIEGRTLEMGSLRNSFVE